MPPASSRFCPGCFVKRAVKATTALFLLSISQLQAAESFPKGATAVPPGPENELFRADQSELVLRVDYESGDLNQAGEGVVAELPTAQDAIAISDETARSGRFCVRTKVAHSDDYISHGKHRAETTVMRQDHVRYSAGDVFRYRFSLRLAEDWQIEPKLPEDRDSVDIIWQCKRFEGGPDLFIGVKREEIVLRTQGGEQRTLFGHYTPGEWMDFCIISRWSTDDDGLIEVFARKASDRSFRSVLSLRGPNLRNAKPKSAYLTWGIYKPDMVNSTATNPRVVFHDDIIVEKRKGEPKPQ